jgi:hypothetical protein
VIQTIFVNIKKLKINVLNVKVVEFVSIKNVKVYALNVMEHIYVSIRNNEINALSAPQKVAVSIANLSEFLVPVGNPTASVATVYCIQI